MEPSIDKLVGTMKSIWEEFVVTLDSVPQLSNNVNRILFHAYTIRVNYLPILQTSLLLQSAITL
jgi:hypothetical protein